VQTVPPDVIDVGEEPDQTAQQSELLLRLEGDRGLEQSEEVRQLDSLGELGELLLE